MAALFTILVLIALAWPLVAVGAAALVVLGLVRLGQVGRGSSRSPSGWGFLLTAGAALAATASYGYGLAKTTVLLMTDAEDRCAIASPSFRGHDHVLRSGGMQSLWPLHDTTCGPDLVPSFVNPLVAALTLLCLTLGAVTVVLRGRRRIEIMARNRAPSYLVRRTK